MNRFLLDVNAVLALLDPMHVHHDAAHRWHRRRSPLRMLTCSHVENGVIRVASQPKYPNCLGTAGRVREAVQQFVRHVRAELCVREVSLIDDKILLSPEHLTPARVSDLYLLALAGANRASLATFDQRIPAAAVTGGVAAMEIIPCSVGADD